MVKTRETRDERDQPVDEAAAVYRLERLAAPARSLNGWLGDQASSQSLKTGGLGVGWGHCSSRNLFSKGESHEKSDSARFNDWAVHGAITGTGLVARSERSLEECRDVLATRKEQRCGWVHCLLPRGFQRLG
jgi:hypothetical protein